MEDRLSELPECLLHRILSFLPLEDQLKTSVLSHKWFNIWSTNHILNLYTSCKAHRYKITLARAVDRCLRLSTSSPPIAIRINVHQHHHLDRWICSASLRSVRDLSLRVCAICHGIRKREPLPKSIYSCVSVTSLKLIGVAFLPPPPDFKGFPFLKKLHLCSVVISNEALRLILSMSPLLETVKMFNCRPSRGRTAVSEMSSEVLFL
ncbi:FBD-associated F-box protein [Acorus calamus]|uniref:FBD-associated F-box protein n=1 Tax=Acorus calamus TaxID=4465 RepID=A0AAV9DEM3_ACOCL|nr:FBD-associated F-box protein [Acorus calamus]